MSLPSQVAVGEPLKASWANAVVSSLRNNKPSKAFPRNSGGSVTVYPPFDPVYMSKEGADWYCKLQEAYLLTPNDTRTSIGYDGDYLNNYPKIKIYEDHDLYYHWENNELLWDTADLKGLLKILECNYTGGGAFALVNLHPNHIDMSTYPPFYPLLCKDGSTYRVTLTRGSVVERAYANTADGMVYTDVDSSYEAIADGQQISLVITTDTHGKLTDATMEIEDLDAPSVSHYPSVAGVEGRDGDYHIKMAEFTIANGLELFACGSNIDFYHDIPLIDNCENGAISATPDIGRVLKEFELNDGKYFFRDIRPAGGQLSVEEQANSILISGNSLSGSLTINVNGTEYTNKLNWKDGLITDGEDIVWNISLSSTSLSTIILSTTSLSTTPFSSVEVPFYCWIGGDLATVTVHCKNEPTIL